MVKRIAEETDSIGIDIACDYRESEQEWIKMFFDSVKWVFRDFIPLEFLKVKIPFHTVHPNCRCVMVGTRYSKRDIWSKK